MSRFEISSPRPLLVDIDEGRAYRPHDALPDGRLAARAALEEAARGDLGIGEALAFAGHDAGERLLRAAYMMTQAEYLDRSIRYRAHPYEFEFAFDEVPPPRVGGVTQFLLDDLARNATAAREVYVAAVKDAKAVLKHLVEDLSRDG